MTHFLHTEADLQAGLAELVIADPRLKPVAEKAGAFNLRRREPGFPGLCAIVCGQQLSTASAAAIRARLFAAFDPFHHDTVRRARADKLRRLGLSAPKIKSIREIGKAVARGRIDLTAVGNMDADVAHAALTARGVAFTHAPHMIHRHSDGTEEWMAFFEDPDARPMAIMSKLVPGGGSGELASRP